MRQYISSASGYFTLKFRQKPPRDKPRSAGQRGVVLGIVRDPLVFDQLLGRQHPFGHLAIAAIGQINLADGRHVVDRLRRRRDLQPTLVGHQSVEEAASQPSS